MGITHHSLSSEKIEQEKPLAFCMDAVKVEQPPKKKRKSNAAAGSMTSKNFGSVLDIPKLKRANRILIGWRVRRSGYQQSALLDFLFGTWILMTFTITELIFDGCNKFDLILIKHLRYGYLSRVTQANPLAPTGWIRRVQRV